MGKCGNKLGWDGLVNKKAGNDGACAPKTHKWNKLFAEKKD